MHTCRASTSWRQSSPTLNRQAFTVSVGGAESASAAEEGLLVCMQHWLRAAQGTLACQSVGRLTALTRWFSCRLTGSGLAMMLACAFLQHLLQTPWGKGSEKLRALSGLEMAGCHMTLFTCASALLAYGPCTAALVRRHMQHT